MAFAPMGGNIVVASSVVEKVCASTPGEKRIAKNVPQRDASIFAGFTLV
jgi:hypothetical protein